MTRSYFIFVNLGVVNIESQRGSFLYVPLVRLRSWVSKAFWILDGAVPVFTPNRSTSPYINCVARKPIEARTAALDRVPG